MTFQNQKNIQPSELLKLELTLILNESLMQALVTKWHGKPVAIGKDIYLIASTILNQNSSHQSN